MARLVEALRYKPEGRGFDFRWCHWNFSLIQSFRPHYGPGVDSASNRNEYQEYFLGVKAGGAYGWQTYHFHVPIVLKSGSVNLLEPSGPVQACNGIALPLHEDRHTFAITSRSVLLRMRNVSDKSCTENQIYITFFHASCRLWDRREKIWYSQEGQRSQHRYRIRNNYCFLHVNNCFANTPQCYKVHCWSCWNFISAIHYNASQGSVFQAYLFITEPSLFSLHCCTVLHVVPMSSLLFLFTHFTTL